MSEFYSDGHRAFQNQFDTRRLADALEEKVMRTALAEKDKRFIAIRFAPKDGGHEAIARCRKGTDTGLLGRFPKRIPTA